MTLSAAGCQAPLSMGFSRQEYWGALPFPPPGDLPDPIKKHIYISILPLTTYSINTKAVLNNFGGYIES